MRDAGYDGMAGWEEGLRQLGEMNGEKPQLLGVAEGKMKSRVESSGSQRGVNWHGSRFIISFCRLSCLVVPASTCLSCPLFLSLPYPRCTTTTTRSFFPK